MDRETYLKLSNLGWDLGRAADRMTKAGDDKGATVASDALAALINLLEWYESRVEAVALSYRFTGPASICTGASLGGAWYSGGSSERSGRAVEGGYGMPRPSAPSFRNSLSSRPS